MPTIMTHAVVGLGLAELAPLPSKPPLLWGLAMALAALPDLDVIGLPLGVPYGSMFGHRGFFHSLCFSVILGLVTALAVQRLIAVPWWQLWLFFAIVTASHGILDGFTNGGLGIAYFSPFDTGRYFFPGQPIQVSPIGMGFFSEWGLRVMRSEILWVWLPLAVIVGAERLLRPR
jgi:inner membrane protein